jgi:hypothetical protein
MDESRRDFLRACLAAGLAASLSPACDDPTIGASLSADGSGPEIRAVWLALFSPRDLFCEDGDPGGTPTPAGVERVLGVIAASGFNTLFLQVDSWYAYSLLHPEFQPRNPLAAFDALGHIERVSANHGLQLHVNYPLVNNRNNPRLPGTAPDFLTECGGSSEWKAKFIDEGGLVTVSHSNVCPSRPETRAWELAVLSGLVERYPRIACFQLEEPGYDSESFCVCDECRRQFALRHGGDLIEEVQRERLVANCPDPACAGHAAAFKCEQLTTMLAEVRDRLGARGFTYSATISYDRWRDRRLGRDWVSWTRRRWFRFAAPMIYVFDSGTFRQALEQGLLPYIDDRCMLCPGIGLHFGGSLHPRPGQRGPDVNSTEEVVRQIATAREVGRASGRVGGVALFLGEYLRPQFRDTGIRLLADIRAAAFPRAVPLPWWLSGLPV